jgi:hypothetical protein
MIEIVAGRVRARGFCLSPGDSLGGPVTTIRRHLSPVLLDLGCCIAIAVDQLRRAAHMVRERLGSGAPPAPVPLGRPVAHVGATEKFGQELRALRTIEVSPELVSDIETELRWGLIWHDFERTMQTEIDRVFAPYLDIAQCCDFDDLRKLIGLRELVAA